ncbi:glycoside hydrolase family 13 protein [Humibacter antri]
MAITVNAHTSGRIDADQWWRDAVIYQIYPRSFADANGDGMGDLRGVLDHLDHLVSLGVDALWLSPFYVSPQADAGYDVADYLDVDPIFGTLADFDALLQAAHASGLKLIVDLVPNHTSSRHAWFRAALASAPGSPERGRYIFRDGKGRDGGEPPNNWRSVFGGPAWTRVEEADGTPGQWYLHLFDPGQPDLDWRSDAVVEAFEDILRFWLDRGVDGFRVDVAHGLIKRDGLPDTDRATEAELAGPMWDQDDVHDIYRGWNAVLAQYRPPRMLVAEAWVFEPERLARYVRHDEMQQAFNFEFLTAGWDAANVKRTIDQALATNARVGATTTWVLSNHDVVRHASRFGEPDAAAARHGIGPDDLQPDAVVGLQRGRAATLMMLALPGSAYLYQGEELGLPEHTTLPANARQDPTFFRTEGARVGRDGCRVPLPWAADAPGFGFGPTGATWLPQPAVFGELAVDRQQGAPGSTLEFYRSAIALRRGLGLGGGGLRWNASDAATLDFENSGVRVIANYGEHPVALPAGAEVLLASDGEAVQRGMLRPDAAVWLR